MLNKNSQRWYFAWENSRGGFCDVLHFVFVLRFVFVLHVISALLYDGVPPWFLWPVKVSTSSELYPTSFNCLFFFIYRECYGLIGYFLSTDIFYLTLLHRHRHFKLRLSRLPWEPAVLT